MFLHICLSLLCFSSAVIAKDTYFNSTAHALKIYGHSYYNPLTRKALKGEIEYERLSFGAPKISFRGLPCVCIEQTCGCCAGLNIIAIKFDRRYCANFTFNPSQFTIDMQVLMNENEIYQTSLSAKNPPPMCIPLPYVPVLNFCLRFYDLSVDDNNLKTCIDFETRLAQSPLLIMHFNCVRVGSSGVSWSNSGDDFINNYTFASIQQQQEQQSSYIFDPVDFEVAEEVTSDMIVLDGTTLSHEEEDKIGQHRIP